MIEFKLNGPIEPDEALELFAQAGWARARTLSDVRWMLAATPLTVSARSSGRLVGMARILTDGVYRGFVEDIIVDSEFQKKGVGKSMVRLIVSALSHVEELTLACGEDLVNYYELLGFTRNRLPHLHVRRGTN